MCGYRIWGIIAGLIGAFLTYFIIGFFGINITSDDARSLAVIVGIGIYLLPTILIWILKKINSATENYQPPNNVTLKKVYWETLISIVKSNCYSKDQGWIEWGNKVTQYIKGKTDQVASLDDNVTIYFPKDTFKALKPIINNQTWKT